MGTHPKGKVKKPEIVEDPWMNPESDFWKLPADIRDRLLDQFPDGAHIDVPGSATISLTTLNTVRELVRSRRVRDADGRIVPAPPMPPVYDLKPNVESAKDPHLFEWLLSLTLGPKRPVRGLPKPLRDQYIIAIWLHHKEQGKSSKEATVRVAKMFGCSDSTVKRALSEHRRVKKEGIGREIGPP